MQKTIGSLRSELKKLENQQRKATIGSEEYIRVTSEINRVRSILREETDNVNRLGREWKDTVESAAEYSNILMGIQSAFQMIDLGIGKIKDLAKDAAAMDDVYGQVMKTTGLTHDEVVKLNEAFKQMDTRTGREQLNMLAYEAGKLGITGVENVRQFVSASDKINVALGDVLGEGAMVTIGKMADVYSKSTDQLRAAGDNLEKKMLSIGSAVNELGKVSTANEGYMVDFAARMGGVATQAGLSAGQVLGFGSALDQSMQKVEMSATAFQKFIGQIMKKPEEFAKQAGMSVEAFSNLIRTDLNEALFAVLEGFQGKGGYAELVNIFKELGLDGARAATVISSMANNIDKIAEAQSVANRELETGTSVLEEVAVMNETLQAKAEKAKKKFQEVRLELGNELYPILISLQKTGTVLLKGFAGTVQLLKSYPALWAPVIAALTALFRVRLLSLAVKVKENIEDKTTIFHKNKELRESRRLELQLMRERVERLKNIKALIEERIQRNNAVLARKKELIAAGQANVVSKAEQGNVILTNRLKNINNALIDAQRTKTQALIAVTKSTPWGLIISGITTVAMLLARQSEKSKEAKERAQELAAEEARVGESSSRAKVEIQRYVDKIKERIEQGGSEKRLLAELNTKYGETFGTYDTLAKWYDVLTSKVEDYVQALLLEAKAKKNIDNAAEMDSQIEAYKKMKAENMEEVKSLNDVQKAWYNLRANVYGVGQKIAGFFSGGTTNTPGRIFDWDAAAEGWSNNGPQKEVDRLWNTYYDNQERQKQQVIANMEETRDAYIRTSEEMLRESARLQTEGGFKIVNSELVTGDDNPAGGGGNGSGESAKEREKRLKKAAKEWEKIKKEAKKLSSTAEVKAESGLGKVADEVAVKFDRMRESIVSAAVAAGKMEIDDDGEIVSMTKEVADLIGELSVCETKWKSAQIDEYIKKMNDELAKQQNKLKDTDANGNEYINKIKEAQRKLVEAFTSYDNAIAQAQADVSALEALQEKASDEEKKNLEGQINALKDLIQQYGILKGQMQARVFDAISTGDVRAKRLSGDESQWRQGVQDEVDTKKQSGLGMLYDKSAFDAYGKALEDIWQKYDKQKKSIGEAREANSKMLDELREKAEADPENEELREKIRLREQELQRLEGEEEALDGLRDSALAAAEEDAFGKAIDKWIAGIEKFGDMAMQLWGNINKILDNVAQKELNEAKKQKEENEELLDEQLENGLISQEEYDEQKETLQDEYDALEKEKQLEIWKRQKALNIGEATMQGALAVLQALASAPPPYNAILAAISAGLAAVQIAAIASEPEPYAKGGFVPRRTVYQAGEAGPEWVASNTLLSDPATAPIIEKLEDYQRGNRRALSDIPMAALDMPAATAAAELIGRNRVVVQPPSAAAVWEHPTAAAVGTDSRELVNLMRELVTYEKDPRNRQAVISRRTMDDFNNNENFLRNRARL